MFQRVGGFFHRTHKNYESLCEPPEIFKDRGDDSNKVLVEMNLVEYRILFSLFNELERADRKYQNDPMTEPKVGLKTIQCEVTELDRECERTVVRPDLMRREAVQVMTMGYKFIRDICNKQEP